MPVQEQEATEISASPRSYADWLQCFAVLKKRGASEEELAFLKNGACTASESSIGFLEEQLVQTVNCMIHRSIRAFQRELELLMMYNEYEGLYRLFRRLAGDIRQCLFFAELSFMSERFRTELCESVKKEVGRFWNGILQSFYEQCIEQNQSELDDELYMIRRIKLFG